MKISTIAGWLGCSSLLAAMILATIRLFHPAVFSAATYSLTLALATLCGVVWVTTIEKNHHD